MGTGKYSPCLPTRHKDYTFFKFNADGEIPPAFEKGSYDSRVHFGNYDPEGFDSYGYSAFDSNGNYVGDGSGVDRHGNTESDYLSSAASACCENCSTLIDDPGPLVPLKRKPVVEAPKCVLPATHFTISKFWDCKDSPVGMCVYTEFSTEDMCIFCGDPHERK